MDPGAYPEPLLRQMFVQCPMVSGYATARLRVADFTFVGTSAGTAYADNACHAIFENVSTGTLFYVQVQQMDDYSPTGTRSSLVGPVAIQAGGGRKTVDFYPTQKYLEVKCTSGAGQLRLQLASRLKWEELAFDKLDTAYPRSLWTVGPKL